jgi:hypothetical protein
MSAKTGNLTAAGTFKSDYSARDKSKTKTYNYIQLGYGVIHIW